MAGLWRVNGELLRAVQAQRPVARATLDMDATLIETHKREALYCYKHFKAYQPLNTWWAEQGLIVHSEFRDGNVPACKARPTAQIADCLSASIMACTISSQPIQPTARTNARTAAFWLASFIDCASASKLSLVTWSWTSVTPPPFDERGGGLADIAEGP